MQTHKQTCACVYTHTYTHIICVLTFCGESAPRTKGTCHWWHLLASLFQMVLLPPPLLHVKMHLYIRIYICVYLLCVWINQIYSVQEYIYMCVYMYMCKRCMRIYVNTYLQTRMHTHTHSQTHVHTRTHACVSTYAYIYICTYAFTYVLMYAYVHVYVCLAYM